MKRLGPNDTVLIVLDGQLTGARRDPRPNMESETGFKIRIGAGFRFEDYVDEGITWIRVDASLAERQAFLVAAALA